MGRCKTCIKKVKRILILKRNPNARRLLSYIESHRTVRGTDQKLCGCCSTWKPLDGFHKSKRSKDGKQSRCRECKSRWDKEYQLTHKIEIVEYKKEHKVEKIKYGKEYYQERKTKILKQQKERRSTIEGYLRHRFDNIDQRCNNSNDTSYKDYGGKGVKNLFKSFDEFLIHVTVDLGFDTIDKIRGLEIHRIKKHYEVGGIEFHTRIEHARLHKEMRKRLTD